jgi:hypothetical protein
MQPRDIGSLPDGAFDTKGRNENWLTACSRTELEHKCGEKVKKSSVDNRSSLTSTYMIHPGGTVS